MLVIHLLNHEHLPEAQEECRVDHLNYHLKWTHDFADKIVRYSLHKQLVTKQEEMLSLTDKGKEHAGQALEFTRLKVALNEG